MSPCFRHQKSICLLAAGALLNQDTQELRRHMQDCPPCADYFHEISAISDRLHLPVGPGIQTSERFHANVLYALQAEVRPRGSFLAELLARWPGIISWRTAIPAAGAAAVALLLFSFVSRSHLPPAATRVVAVESDARNLAGWPTLASYQAAADKSFEELDHLLSAQGQQGLPPVPRFRDLD